MQAVIFDRQIEAAMKKISVSLCGRAHALALISEPHTGAAR
jgi:hypothetical protein